MKPCESFNPNLPENEPEQWVSQWKTNFLNDNCVQRCASICAAEIFTQDCQSCLEEADCPTAANCLNCTGVETTPSFEDIFNCTVPNPLTAAEIVGIVFGVIIGVILISFLVIFILKKCKMLSKETLNRLKGFENFWQKLFTKF